MVTNTSNCYCHTSNFSLKYMRISLLGMLLFVQLVFPQDKIDFVDYETIIQSASNKKDQGDIDGVLSELSKINRNDSLYYGVLSERAYYNLVNKDYEKVLSICNQGLASDSDAYRVNFWINKTVAQLNLKQYDEALATITEAQQVYPMNTKLWFNKAYILEQMGNLEEAARVYQEALKLDPFYGRVYLQLGLINYNQGQMAQALMCFDMYLLWDPDGEDAPRFLKALDNLVRATNTSEVNPNLKLSPDDTSFEEINLILDQKVALNEGYDTGCEVDMGLTRQNHAMFSLLENFKGKGGFWDKTMVPFYRGIMEQGNFNIFTYTISYSTENSEDKRRIDRKEEDLIEYLIGERRRWAKIIGNYETSNKKTAGLTYAYAEGRMDGIGKMQDTTYVGPWTFYDDDGKVSANGTFDEKGERHGKWEWYYKPGKVQEAAEYKHGILEGAFASFHKNGRKYLEGSYKDGKLDGVFKIYNDLGALVQKKHFVEGELDGKFQSFFAIGEAQPEFDIDYVKGEAQGVVKEFHYNGKLYAETPYKNDKIEGWEKKYNSDGILIYKAFYENGLMNGDYESYFNSGKINEKGLVKEGKRVGVWKSFYEDGQTRAEIEYEDGEIQGSGRYYSREGKLSTEYTYRRGEIIAYTTYDKNGKVLSEGRKKGGEFHYKGYSINGLLESEGLYDVSGGKMGEWKFYNENGGLATLGKFVEDERDGTYKEYFPNGQIQSIWEYDKGTLNGYYADYYLDGTLRNQGWYKDDVKQGEWRSYYKDGLLQSVEYYHNNSRNGEQVHYAVDGSLLRKDRYEFGKLMSETYFDPDGKEFETIDMEANRTGTIRYHHFNGNLRSEHNYLNGVIHGTSIWKDFYGNTELEGEYLGGNQHGIWKWYYPDGTLETERPYSIGQKHGTSKWYYENGSLNKEYNYKFDTPSGKWLTYYEDGTLMVSSYFDAGSYDGRVEFYDPNGHLQLVEFYDHDSIIGYSYLGEDGKEVPMVPLENETGIVKTYFDNGKLAKEFEYKHEHIIGVSKTYHYDGSLQNEKNYQDGEYHGVNRFYYPNGNLKRTTEYLNGDKHGMEVEYDEQGKKKTETSYLNGEQHGVTTHYDASGKVKTKEYYFDGDIFKVEKG